MLLYGYLYSASHRRLFTGTLSMTGRRKEVFKLRRDADYIPCSITLRSAGGVSFKSTGPTTEKARFWEREVRDHDIRISQRSAELSGRQERAVSGLDISS